MNAITAVTNANIIVDGSSGNYPKSNVSWSSDFKSDSAFYESDSLYRVKQSWLLGSGGVPYPTSAKYIYTVNQQYLPLDANGTPLPFTENSCLVYRDNACYITSEVWVFGKVAKFYEASTGVITERNSQSGMWGSVKYTCAY